MAGSAEPAADAEVISLAKAVLDTLGLKGIQLYINSIGCPTCRAEYHKALRAYFEGRRDELCETCRERLEKNPMRILDCKSPVCGEIAKGAPRVLDYLCGDCRDHFEKVQTLLKDADIPFTIDAGIVRGLDYYTRTVFEISVPGFPALCGGGRYGGLSRQLGGPDVEGIGFAIPINTAMEISRQLIESGSVARPALGVKIMDVTDAQTAAQLGVNAYGVYVVEVVKGGPADKAGLQAGDRIVSVDGSEVATQSDLGTLMQNHKAGDTIEITVARGGQMQTVNVTLGEKGAEND